MEQFENFSTDSVTDTTLGMGVDESPEFFDAEQPAEDSAIESPFTDDPVRVYLREMGSVSLLTRKDEIDLAQKMERGKHRRNAGHIDIRCPRLTRPPACARDPRAAP